MATTQPVANTATVQARYPDLKIGSTVPVTSYHTEQLPADRARLVEVYETGSAVLVEFGTGDFRYVWDTQL